MKRQFLLLLSIFIVQLGFAQQAILTGYFKDLSSNDPIGFGSVSLVDANGKIAGGLLIGQDGKFTFNDISFGAYRLNFKSIGYLTKDTLIEVRNKRIDLGDCFVKLAVNSIEAVSLRGVNQVQRHESNKQSYQANQFKSAIGGTALDLVKNLPSVTLDGSGSIHVRGNAGVMILINDKPTFLDPTTILSQIAANDVGEIEFITSPRADNDPDGKGGIINIKTKKSVTNGSAWVVNLQGGLPSFHDYDNRLSQKRFGGDVLFQYKKNKFEFQGALNYLRNDNAGYREGDVYTIVGEKKTFFPSNGERSFDKYNYGIRLNGSYDISDLQGLRVGLLTSKKYQDRVADIYYDNKAYSTVMGEQLYNLKYFNPNLQNKQGKFYLFDINYFLKVNALNKLDFGVIYEYADIYGSTNNGNIVGRDTIQWTRNTYSNPLRGVRFSVQHSYEPNKNSKLVSGYQLRNDQQNGDFVYKTSEDGLDNFHVIPEFTGQLKASNIVHALFSQYSNKFGPTSLSFGLRYEYYHRHINLITSQQKYPYTTNQLYPNLDLKHDWSHDWTWKASVSRRIQRNNNFELNPIPEREHSETLEQGDPELLPEFVTNSETGIIKKFKGGLFFTNVYYQHSKNPLQRVNSVYNDTILYRVFTNADYARRWGIEVGGEWSPVSILKIMYGANAYNYKVTGKVLDYKNVFANRDWVYSFNASGIVQLPKKFTLAMDINYLSERPTLQGLDSRFITPNMSLSRAFFKGALTAQIQWKNIELGKWGVNEQRITTMSNDFYTTTNYVYEKNIVLINLNFNINKLNNILKLPKSEFGEKEF